MIYSRMEFLIEKSGTQTNMGKSISQNIYPKRKNLPTGEIFDKLLFECFIPLPSVLIRSELFHQVGGSLKVAEDYDIFLKIAKISKVKAIDSVSCKYRVHENNLSHQNMEKTFEESIELVKKYFQLQFAKEAISYWNCKKEYYKDSRNILVKLKYVFKVLFNKARGIL